MSTRYAFLCLAIAAVTANAEDAPILGQPSAQAAAQTDKSVTPPSSALLKPRAAVQMAAPIVSQTTAVRAPDGSLQINCSEQRNPNARAVNAKIKSAAAKVPNP